jgi:N,N-dimethylformamidase
MSRSEIRGYCDRPNVRPGEALDFHVASSRAGRAQASLVRLIHGDRNPDGPGYKEEKVAARVPREIAVGPRRTQVGGYVGIADDAAALAGTTGLTIHLHFWPTLPQLRQGVISRWSEADGSGWALVIEDGRLVLVVGDGRRRTRVAAQAMLFPELWYSVVARIDVANRTASLSQVATRFMPSWSELTTQISAIRMKECTAVASWCATRKWIGCQVPVWYSRLMSSTSVSISLMYSR